MSIFLFPLKILSVPAKGLASFLGVLVAACVNAFIIRQLFCWMAWNFGWSFLSLTMLNIITLAAFVLTFPASGGK